MTATARPLPAALSLAGRRICITGAANGIGRATAHAAAELGADLLLTDREPLAEVAATLRAGGTKVDVHEGDLTADGFAEALLATGPVDGLAHCAGIIVGKPLMQASDVRARFQRTMDINVLVPITLGSVFADHMAERGGGAIVLIGSVAGRTGGTSTKTPVDYAASKGALHTVVRWLSRSAIGRGVLVNGIAPGPVRTAMTAGSLIDPQALPRGRMGEPEEIAWMITMLLTPAASYISGAILDCNGGSYVG
jgi:3-oxoacyl-[acyl-carrier protein] reductase